MKVEVRNAHVQLIRRNVELSLVGVARRGMMKCLLIRMSRAFEQAALDSMLSQIRRVTHSHTPAFFCKYFRLLANFIVLGYARLK